MPPASQDGSLTLLLKEGILAARKGEYGRARDLLLQVVERDERNEAAWLWLSGVVETAEDRLICLENVLAINPENGAARKGLEKLGKAGVSAEPSFSADPEYIEDGSRKNTAEPDFSPTEEEGVVEYHFRKELPPISAAAAVLYPERQVMEMHWEEKTSLHAIPAVTYESKSGYDDIWEKETEICAFCAGEVEYDEAECPHCKRKLTASHFLYEKNSADMIVYFVMLIGTAQLYFIQALIDLIVAEPLVVVAWHIFLFLVLFGLSGAVLLRRFWAYSVSVIALILIFLSMVLDVTTGLAALNLETTQSGIEFLQQMADNPFVVLISPLLEYVVPFQMLAIFLALVYGIFKAGPDFERVKVRLIAGVDKGPADGSAFYETGKRYAKKGMWASAVLHFRRASAHEPNRAYYHFTEGMAFAELGFRERAMDAFRSAQRLATSEKLRGEIEAAVSRVEGWNN